MIYDTVSGEVEWIPVVGKENGVMKAEGEEKEKILRDFAARSATLQDGTWKEGWHAHCVGEKERYFKAIACACNEDSTDRQQQKFAHYLDCEAHTDVWRELFPTYNQYNEK